MLIKNKHGFVVISIIASYKPSQRLVKKWLLDEKTIEVLRLYLLKNTIIEWSLS